MAPTRFSTSTSRRSASLPCPALPTPAPVSTRTTLAGSRWRGRHDRKRIPEFKWFTCSEEVRRPKQLQKVLKLARSTPPRSPPQTRGGRSRVRRKNAMRTIVCSLSSYAGSVSIKRRHDGCRAFMRWTGEKWARWVTMHFLRRISCRCAHFLPRHSPTPTLPPPRRDAVAIVERLRKTWEQYLEEDRSKNPQRAFYNVSRKVAADEILAALKEARR